MTGALSSRSEGGGTSDHCGTSGSGGRSASRYDRTCLVVTPRAGARVPPATSSKVPCTFVERHSHSRSEAPELTTEPPSPRWPSSRGTPPRLRGPIRSLVGGGSPPPHGRGEAGPWNVYRNGKAPDHACDPPWHEGILREERCPDLGARAVTAQPLTLRKKATPNVPSLRGTQWT